MAYPHGIRVGVWGTIAAFFPFSVILLILTTLEYKFNIHIAVDIYGKILFIPSFVGLIFGIITGWIYDYKFNKIKKNISNEEIKKIYNKEFFYLAILTFISIALFCITCYIFISSQI